MEGIDWTAYKQTPDLHVDCSGFYRFGCKVIQWWENGRDWSRLRDIPIPEVSTGWEEIHRMQMNNMTIHGLVDGGDTGKQGELVKSFQEAQPQHYIHAHIDNASPEVSAQNILKGCTAHVDHCVQRYLKTALSIHSFATVIETIFLAVEIAVLVEEGKCLKKISQDVTQLQERLDKLVLEVTALLQAPTPYKVVNIKYAILILQGDVKGLNGIIQGNRARANDHMWLSLLGAAASLGTGGFMYHIYSRAAVTSAVAFGLVGVNCVAGVGFLATSYLHCQNRDELDGYLHQLAKFGTQIKTTLETLPIQKRVE